MKDFVLRFPTTTSRIKMANEWLDCAKIYLTLADASNVLGNHEEFERHMEDVERCKEKAARLLGFMNADGMYKYMSIHGTLK